MKTKTKALLAFLTVFLLGGLSGYLINDSINSVNHDWTENRYDSQQRMHERSFNTEDERAAYRLQMRRRAETRLSERLNLSDSQQAEFFNKLYDYHTEIRDSVRSIKYVERQFVREQYSRFRDDVSGVLNAEQTERLDRYFHPDSIRQNQSQRNRR
ncbi:hypothetical protein [Rhodohalobacter sp.]|uniref:hypothetical protein n=1 Tax=Rhodohalobacter sp. TaxID=1974210 RepID=UPI003565527A